MNELYRKLLENGRTYASFTNHELDLIFKELSNNSQILDPMSGYGGLMNYCEQLNIDTYNIEVNPPAFFWQVLMNPMNSPSFINTIVNILSDKKLWPRTTTHVNVSDNWFNAVNILLINKLISFTKKRLAFNKLTKETSNILSLSIIIPFVSRFSNSVNGDITHIKKGGFCVFDNWQNDFETYLNSLLHRLYKNIPAKSKHVNLLADITNKDLKINTKFDSFITSPPYPNYRDYNKMFAPENYFLTTQELISNSHVTMIGSNSIKFRSMKKSISSKTANNFLYRLANYKCSEKKRMQIKRYYLPYFQLYFSDIEIAYLNVSNLLNKKCEGYLIVVNNTTRNLVIPNAEITIELWTNLGFKTKIINQTEQFHFGTKSPNSKGIKAKHVKYIIKVWKK